METSKGTNSALYTELQESVKDELHMATLSSNLHGLKGPREQCRVRPTSRVHSLHLLSVLCLTGEPVMNFPHPSVFHSPHFGSRVSWSLSQLTGFGLREEARDTRRKPTEAQGETCKVHSRKARDEIQMPNLRIIQAVFEVTLCKLATSQDHKFGGHNSHLLGSKYHHSGFQIKQTKCALTTDVRF